MATAMLRPAEGFLANKAHKQHLEEVMGDSKDGTTCCLITM